MPLAFALGLIVLTFLLAAMILFSPIFIVLVLPCICLVKCTKKDPNVIKINQEEQAEQVPLRPTNLSAQENNGAAAVITNQPFRIEEEPNSV